MEQTIQKITEWMQNEKTEIIQYQTEAWAEGKAQLARNADQITEIFQKVANFIQ